MQNLLGDNRTKIVAVLILLAAVSRLIPHPANFAPVGAIALFGGCYISNKRMAFALPLGVMLLSDILIEFFYGYGLHPILPFVYLAFAVITLFGFMLRGREQRQTIMVASLVGSIVFFLITNAGQWATGYYGDYSLQALKTSMIQGIPFFRGTVMGDLFYNLVLFGSYSLIKWRFPVLLQAKK